LKLIVVDYEILPALVDPEASLREEKNKIHESTKQGNISKHVDLSFGPVEEALKRSAAVVEQEFFYEGSAHAPIEPHCALAQYDSDGNLTVWSSTQIGHYLHRELSRVLGLPETRVRVVQPQVGGAFGG